MSNVLDGQLQLLLSRLSHRPSPGSRSCKDRRPNDWDKRKANGIEQETGIGGPEEGTLAITKPGWKCR